MKTIDKVSVTLIMIVLLSVSVIFYNILSNSQKKYDMPEEFNSKTISHDRTKPTEMMVVYDTLSNTYIFEFMDN
jgi:hypothetical protein